MFKRTIVNDPRFISLALNEEDDYTAYLNNQIARITAALKCDDIIGLIEVLVHKVLVNLVYNAESPALVKSSLDLLSSFVSGHNSSRLLLKVSVVRDLMENHLQRYEILASERSSKYLSRFYKILTALWTHEDNYPNFRAFLNTFSPLLTQLLEVQNEALASQFRVDVLKLFHVLRGVVSGLSSVR